LIMGLRKNRATQRLESAMATPPPPIAADVRNCRPLAHAPGFYAGEDENGGELLHAPTIYGRTVAAVASEAAGHDG